MSTVTAHYDGDAINAGLLTVNEARVIALSPAYQMDVASRAELAAAEAEALEAIASHAATVRRLSAELRVSKAETARLRSILKHRGIRA